jgi:SAM-dependent methyltransferase
VTGATDPAGGWPFWAPLGDEEIADALALASLRPGERFLDLGCGDGRVMVAALEAGAHASGYEVDGALAARARERLAGAGGRARVIDRSFFDAPLDAEVVFAYLSPAMLQRLRPQLELLPSASRVVTAWFDVPGWAPPTARRRNVRCYTATSVVSTSAPVPAAAGWPSPGLLCVLPTAGKILATTSLAHPRGPVAIAVDDALSDLVAITAGADAVIGDLATIAVDLVIAPHSVGAAVTGTLHAPAAGTCELFCLTSTTSPPGSWPIGAARCARLRALFRASASYP